MALCVMLVGGNVLHQHCRQAGALLWMNRRLNIALGLPHAKQKSIIPSCMLSFLSHVDITSWFQGIEKEFVSGKLRARGWKLFRKQLKKKCGLRVPYVYPQNAREFLASNYKNKCHQMCWIGVYINGKFFIISIIMLPISDYHEYIVYKCLLKLNHIN